MSIFVVIVTYNGLNWLDKCIGYSLKSSIFVKVIVIDNGSTDSTVSYIRQYYPDVLLVESKANLGFAKANNIGMRRALQEGADYVFLLNQDAWLEFDTLKTLLRAASNNIQYGILSPVHLNGSGDRLDRNFKNYLLKTSNFYDDAVIGKSKDVYEIPFINAAAWLITKQCLLSVGGFDTQMFHHYGEDENYCHRVYFHSLKVGVVAHSFIFHDRETRPSSKKLNRERVLISYKIRLTDINNADPGHTTKVFRKLRAELCIRMFKSLIRRNISDAKSYFWVLRKIIRLNRTILMDNMTANRQNGSTWLN